MMSSALRFLIEALSIILFSPIVFILALEFMYYLEIIITLIPTEYTSSILIRQFFVNLHLNNIHLSCYRLAGEDIIVDLYNYIVKYSISMSSYWFLLTYIVIFIFLLVLSI
jgi:hypothetical protein